MNIVLYINQLTFTSDTHTCVVIILCHVHYVWAWRNPMIHICFTCTHLLVYTHTKHTQTHSCALMNWTFPISCCTETRWPFQPLVWNRLKWSLNVDCKSKCVCVYSAAASRLHCEMDFQTRKVMNILIAADNATNTMNIIQCVVCLCSCPCVSICVCLCWGVEASRRC